MNSRSIKALFRCASASLKAYFLSDLIRAKGAVFGLIGLGIWLIIFILPMTLFASATTDRSVIAAYMLSGIMVFSIYSIGTWDWGWEMRVLINYGIFEYVMVTGVHPLVIYLGLVPLSLIWILVIIGIGYSVISAFVAVPKIIISNIPLFLLAFLLLIVVVLSYALILGTTTMLTGTSGMVVEIVSWILPMATGGFVPLKLMPEPLRTIALYTPFSYPAEVLRYSMGISETVMDPNLMFIIGYAYALAFLGFGIVLYNYGLKKLLREGVKTVSAW